MRKIFTHILIVSILSMLTSCYGYRHPKISQSQMASKLGIPVNRVKYYINKMRHEQRIVREGTSQKGKWIVL